MAWNGSGGASAPKKAPPKKDGLAVGKGALAGVIVVAAAALAFCIMLGKSDSVVFNSKDDKRTSAIGEAIPAVSGRTNSLHAQNVVSGVEKPQGTEPVAIVGSEALPDTAEVDSDADRGSVTNKDTRAFKTGMDQLLAMAMPTEAGDAIPPLPITDDMEFTPEEEKALLKPLEADENDSDRVLNRKEIVQGLRDEFLELKKKGWTFAEYLKALEEKARTDSEVKETSFKIYEEAYHDDELTDENVLKVLEKVNSVLNSRGIKSFEPTANGAAEAEPEQVEEEKKGNQ